jgi:hypothetical protein
MISVNGLSGEILVGGRKAANLGRWSLSGDKGSFICEAAALDADDYLLSLPSARVLRLHVGTRRWTFRGVEVGGDGPQLTISGTGTPRIEERA